MHVSNESFAVSFGKLFTLPPILVETSQGEKGVAYDLNRKRVSEWIDKYRNNQYTLLSEYKKEQNKYKYPNISIETFGNMKCIEGFFNYVNALAETYIEKTIKSIESFDSAKGKYLLTTKLLQRIFNTDVISLRSFEMDRFGDNCYEFAMDDAFSSDDILDLIINPGFTCEESKAYVNAFNKGIAIGKPPKEEDWAILMAADLATVQKRIYRVNNPDTPVTQGRIRIAAVCGDCDYHFYRYFPAYGYWAHKPGSWPIRALDNSGNLIKDVRTCNRGRYDHIIGFYEIE